MSGGIFLIQSGGELVEMTEQPYDTEAVLQELLAKYPNVLAGDQIGGAVPRRWLLVSREMGVPSQDAGSDRWSLDHLFLDQDAIPTLIEVKRSSDTRIRREVVGQMLDYAANGVAYWPVEAIRARFEEGCRQRATDPAQEIERLVGPGSDPEAFWQRVKTNLQAGKIRMVFVADIIPPELRRIVEFLNGQMDPAEVLAVEIKQFVGGGLKTLVPRVIGQTSKAEGVKGGSGERQWDETTFFQELKIGREEAEVQAARALLSWAIKSGLRVFWGKGAKFGSFFPVLDHKGREYSAFGVWTYGKIEIPFQWMVNTKSFGHEAKRQELRARLIEIPGVEIPADAINRRPAFPLFAVGNAEAMGKFLATMDWYLSEVKAV